jgi:hypothetical protein
MLKVFNRRTDWIGALAFLFGAAVIAPSMIAFSLSLLAVARTLF